MIYELFEGFSEGFWTDLSKEEIDENFAKRGITIFHTSHGTRRIFIDDTVNEFEAIVCRSRRDAKQAGPDWKSLYEKMESVYGYGSLHPYYEEKSHFR